MNTDLEYGICSYHKQLRRYAYARTRDPSEADDAVQECMIRALAYARDDRTIHNIRAYLFAILNNVLADAGSRANRSEHLIHLDADIAVATQLPEQIARIEWQELVRAIESLPEDQRRAIILVAVFGEPYHVAAQIMNVPVGTIMSRLYRGRRALRQQFSDTQANQPCPGAPETDC